MLSLLPIGQVIAYIAVVYAFLVVLLLLALQSLSASLTIWSSLPIATYGAGALQFGLTVWFRSAWRNVWRRFPALGGLLFPDIGGDWDMEITWHGPQKSGGVVNARASIKQDFVRFSMEVKSANSDSQTLVAQPKKDPESGRPLLYYVYRVTSKSLGPKSGTQYCGAAILSFSEDGGGELSGNYWTTQDTKGHFKLCRHKGEG